MKNKQNSIVNMGSFVYMMSAAVAFVLVVCFRWNFFIAVSLSAFVGEGFIRPLLVRETSDKKNVPKLIASAYRGWWAIAGLSIAPVLFVLANRHFVIFDDYYWGVVIIIAALVNAGWIDWNHNRRLRTGLLSLACISWFLSFIPGISMFLALGLTAMAFFWSFADSLPDNQVRGDTDWTFEETSRNDQWRESDRLLGQTMDNSSNLQRGSTLQISLIVICPKCKTRVLPKTDGTCPSCRAKISK